MIAIFYHEKSIDMDLSYLSNGSNSFEFENLSSYISLFMKFSLTTIIPRTISITVHPISVNANYHGLFPNFNVYYFDAPLN